MSNTLVVVYSYTGVSRRLAQLLCAQQGWTLAEVLDERPRSGAGGYLRSVLDSVLRRQPPVRYQGPDPSGFSCVVLISPIWAYQLAGPMRSFVARWRKSLRDVAVLSTMGSRGAPNAVVEISELLGRAPVLAAAFTAREVEDGSCAARLQAFGDALRPDRVAAEPVRASIWSPQAG